MNPQVPKLAVTVTFAPPKQNFFDANCSRNRSTVGWMCLWSTCVSTNRNSSPPIRPQISDARVYSFRIAANSLRT